MNFREKIFNIANTQIVKLKEVYPVSFEEIKIIVDEESPKDKGAGYFKSETPNSIYIITDYFKEKQDLYYPISKTSSHEFCHLYINDKRYIEGGRFNKDIEKEVIRLIKKYQIDIPKNNNKYDLNKLLSSYANREASVNAWHEVLAEAFSLYHCYDYIKNENSLIYRSYDVHKELVDYLLNYKIPETSFIDDLDFDY